MAFQVAGTISRGGLGYQSGNILGVPLEHLKKKPLIRLHLEHCNVDLDVHYVWYTEEEDDSSSKESSDDDDAENDAREYGEKDDEVQLNIDKDVGKILRRRKKDSRKGSFRQTTTGVTMWIFEGCLVSLYLIVMSS